jgi:hypothetical protein
MANPITIQRARFKNTLVVPTDSDQVAPELGSLRYNSTDGALEIWKGTSWVSVGSTVSSEINLVAPGGTVADAAILVEEAGLEPHLGSMRVIADQVTFEGSDGSVQFRVGNTPEADEYVLAVGALSGGGATLVAASDTNANVDLNFAGKGTGGVYVGNGAGTIFRFIDEGTAMFLANSLSAKGGSGSNLPVLGSNVGLQIDVPTSNEVFLGVNNQRHMSVANLTGNDTVVTENYLSVSGSAGNSSVRLQVRGPGTSNTAGLFIAARNNGQITFANGRGNLLAMSPFADVTVAASFLMRPGGTGVSPLLTSNGSDTNIGLRIGVQGTGTLELEGQWNSIENAVCYPTFTRGTYADGFSIIIGNNVSGLVIDGSATIPSGSVTLPATPVNGQTIFITTNVAITSITVSANAGHTIVGAPTTMSASTPVRLMFVSAANRWYRV